MYCKLRNERRVRLGRFIVGIPMVRGFYQSLNSKNDFFNIYLMVLNSPEAAVNPNIWAGSISSKLCSRETEDPMHPIRIATHK